MKKKINILTLLACALIVTACGGKEDSSSINPTTPGLTTVTTSDPTSASTSDPTSVTTSEPTTSVTPSTTTVTPPSSTTVTPPPSVDTTVHVTSINIVEESLVLEEGTNGNLTVEVLPVDADDKSFTYSVGDPSVASVSDDGTVLAISEGSTFISVTSTDGGLTDSVSVSVYKTYSITASVDAGITVDIPSKAQAGDLVNVGLSYDDSALVVKGVFANDIALGTSGDGYYFYMPAEDVVITVVSEAVKHYYNVVNVNSSSVTLDTTGAYCAGDDVEISFSIAPGYQFAGSVTVYKNIDAFDPVDKIVVDSTMVNGVIRFEMPAENVEIVVAVETATFALTKGNDAFAHISSFTADSKSLSATSGIYDVKFGQEVKVYFVSETNDNCAKSKPTAIYIPEMNLTVAVSDSSASFVMPHYNVSIDVITESVFRNITLVGSEHISLALFSKVDGEYVPLSENKAIYEDVVYVKATSSDSNFALRTLTGVYTIEDASYDSDLTLTLEADGYYSFSMPKIDLSIPLTITATEKNMTKFADADFLGSYLGVEIWTNKTTTTFTSSKSSVVDASGLLTQSSSEITINSYDATTHMLSVTNGNGAEGVAYFNDKLIASHYTYGNTTLVTSDMTFLIKKQSADDSDSLYSLYLIRMNGTHYVGEVYRDGVLYVTFVADINTQTVHYNPVFTFTSGEHVTDSGASYTVSVDGVLIYNVTNQTTISVFDGYQGTYTSTNGDTLVLDGAGNATYGGQTLPYVINEDKTISLISTTSSSIEKTIITLDGTTFEITGTVSEDLAPVYGRYFSGSTSYNYGIHIAFTSANTCVIYVLYDISTDSVPSSASYGYDGNASYIYDSASSTISITSTAGTATFTLGGEAGSYTLTCVESTLSFYGGGVKANAVLSEFQIA